LINLAILIVDKQRVSAISKRKIKKGEGMFYKTKKLFTVGIVVSALFICGTLELSVAEKRHLIVIDPAHGGQDTGVKLTDKVSEKDITLAIALALQKEIVKENIFEVILTRDSDKTVSLEERKKNIAKIKPDFFLSLHVNAGFGKSAAGFELYYPGFKYPAEEKKMTKGGTRKAKNKYLNDSIRLAQIIQKNLDTLFPRKGRGLREADLPIIEDLFVPALVVEMGFASNSEDKKKLLSPNTQTEIAKALAKSIRSYFR